MICQELFCMLDPDDLFPPGGDLLKRIVKDGDPYPGQPVKSFRFVKERYSSYESGIGKKIRDGEVTLEDCAEYAAQMKKPENPGSGRQEYLENIVNNILFNSQS